MLRRILSSLRVKFIVLNVTLVMSVIIGVLACVGYFNHRNNLSNLFDTLDTVLKRDVYSINSHPERDASYFDTPNSLSIGGNDDERTVIPVGVYLIHGDQTLLLKTRYTTATIDDDNVRIASSKIVAAPSNQGCLAEIRLCYVKSESMVGTFVAVTDIKFAQDWRQLAVNLTLIGLAAFAVVFVISLRFSAWALRPVEEAWAKQRQFISDASHELKTPLSVVLANTAIVMNHPDDTVASQSRWLESTQYEAEEMQSLVADLLTIASLEHAELTEGQRQQINLSDLVNRQVLQFESVAFDSGVEIVAEIEDEVKVLGDERHLSRLCATLIDNACKYTNKSGTVWVRLVKESRHAVLAFTNTGEPISRRDLPHIFDRFYRSNRARTHETSSYGLGLAIASDIVKAHKGTIQVASTIDRGTTFTVTLPLG